MDFERVLRTLLEEFGHHQIRYAAIGGIAMALLGAPRATMDLDFLVHRDDLTSLDAVLQGLGYERIFRTENVSHYRHKEEPWGSIDFLHAFRKFALAMLERSKSYPLFADAPPIRVVDPEDVIGLKVQAIVNDPDRRLQDLGDIERLMMIHGGRLDWDRLQEFYDLFSLGEEVKELRRRFARA